MGRTSRSTARTRAYVPSNPWAKIKDELVAEVEGMKMGDPRDFDREVVPGWRWRLRKGLPEHPGRREDAFYRTRS